MSELIESKEIQKTKPSKRIKGDNIVTLVEQHIISKKHKQWKECDRLCFLAKNLYNAGLYQYRQFYFENKKLLKYTDLDKQFNSTNQSDYRAISARSSCALIRLIDQNYKSFFASIKDYGKNPNKYKAKPKLPKYLDKVKGRQVITFDYLQGKIKNGFIHFPKKENLLPLKTKVLAEQFRQVRIVPKASCYIIEVVYEINNQININLDFNHYLGIDMGVDILAAITSNKPGLRPMLINGRIAKSINQNYNKLTSKHKSNLDNQINLLNKNLKTDEKIKTKTSNKIKQTTLKRNNSIKTYLHQCSKFIVDYCNDNNIGNIIIGLNKGWKQKSKMSKKNNQHFIQIPFAELINMITYKANLIGIKVETIHEAYTSKCSALDLEPINKHEIYMGKRIKSKNHEFKGSFITSENKIINDDVNGSLNILRKVIGNDFINLTNMVELAVQPLLVSPCKTSYQSFKNNLFKSACSNNKLLIA